MNIALHGDSFSALLCAWVCSFQAWVEGSVQFHEAPKQKMLLRELYCSAKFWQGPTTPNIHHVALWPVIYICLAKICCARQICAEYQLFEIPPLLSPIYSIRMNFNVQPKSVGPVTSLSVKDQGLIKAGCNSEQFDCLTKFCQVPTKLHVNYTAFWLVTCLLSKIITQLYETGPSFKGQLTAEFFAYGHYSLLIGLTQNFSVTWSTWYMYLWVTSLNS